MPHTYDMVLASNIISEIETLPHEYLPEVSGFIASLKARAGKAARPPFEFGCMEGEFTIASDFDAPLEDMLEYTQ